MTNQHEDYEEGDVNALPEDDVDLSSDDEYVAGDINAVVEVEEVDVDLGDLEDERTGNRTDDGTPATVLRYLAHSLANEPEAVVIQSEVRQGAVRLRLHVAPEDMGRVIGRRGRTAQAIRTLIAVAGARDGVQTSVDIVDD